MKTKVIVKKLLSSHQSESFTNYLPLNGALVSDINKAVTAIFDELGGSSLLKASGDVYIKPNAVDAKPYSHTRVEVLREIILYWKKAGAKKIYLFENSTQANYTRLVYKATGYARLCRETGAIPVYLDEEKSRPLTFNGRGPAGVMEPDGYDLTSFDMPQTVIRLMEERDRHLYINVPKLKTHSMGVVTLGVKNQWGFPMQKCRGFDHNYNLPQKLVDVLGHVRPDITLIEGIEGTIHGHYFATALADKQVRPFRVLIAGTNVVAADIVGARIFGLNVDDVPHLKIAIERGLSNGVMGPQDIALSGDLASLEKIDLIGDMPANGHYPWDLYPEFPPDVTVIKGKKLACREGCLNNPLCVLQTMYMDNGGKGGWTLVLGKGHDPSVIDNINGRVLVAGYCAIEEVSENLIKRLGRKKVYLSGECNNLCSTVEAMFHLMKVNPVSYVPINPIAISAAFLMARMKGSTSRVPHPLSHIIKRV
ncbi:MAG: hypothetical protein CVU62_01570 [Deltaproteobacteria bacterium HGW-Deltaproteobacteria-2]|jgi:uncharacterized protein (DUF362 family)|nr:MAG: hypothetical protein CVU62_01570 [Deltaproteobacteria bacterium HGW-Deltaproteobacteria-2]